MSRPAAHPGRLTLLALLIAAGPAAAQPPEVAPPPHAASLEPTRPPDPEPPANPADPCAATRIDRDRLHFRYVRDSAYIQHEDQNEQEFRAYNEVLLHAHRLPVATLERCANRDVTFLDLVKEVRKDFQFTLVYLEGRLKRLRRLEPTRPLAEAGVTDLYEGWMFPKDRADPICVLVTELPPGLAPARDFDPGRPVAVAGYSFKLLYYESSEKDPNNPKKNVVRKAPLIMGHSFTLLPEPAGDGGESWRTAFLPGMLAVVAGIGILVLGLIWWFRRGDRRVRIELDSRRDQNPFDGGSTPV